MNSPSGPVVCVSYLALAELWTVPRFPLANHGAEIRSVERSVTADGPMTAAVLASMGAPTHLIANSIGDDEPGRFVRQWLNPRHMTIDRAAAATATPRIVVTGDDQHTRTWFAHLPGVVASLERADLSPVADASFVYLDCYELIESAVLRVIEAVIAAGVPLLLNLGGSDLSPDVAAAVRGYAGLLVQTNVDDAAHDDASHRSISAGPDASSLGDCHGRRLRRCGTQPIGSGVSTSFPGDGSSYPLCRGGVFRRAALRTQGRMVNAAQFGSWIGQRGAAVCTTSECPAADAG